jgi:hypothetical protein
MFVPIHLQNTGNVGLTNVNVPNSINCSLPGMEPASSIRCALAVQLVQADFEAAGINISISATALPRAGVVALSGALESRARVILDVVRLLAVDVSTNTSSVAAAGETRLLPMLRANDSCAGNTVIVLPIHHACLSPSNLRTQVRLLR